jgi:hypothetical protein
VVVEAVRQVAQLLHQVVQAAAVFLEVLVRLEQQALDLQAGMAQAAEVMAVVVAVAQAL